MIKNKYAKHFSLENEVFNRFYKIIVQKMSDSDLSNYSTRKRWDMSKL